MVCLHMQLICLAKKRGTKVINVVRRGDVVQELKDLGCASLISGLHGFLHGKPCCVVSARAAPCAQGSAKVMCCTRLPKLHVSGVSVLRCICTAGWPAKVAWVSCAQGHAEASLVCCLGLAALPLMSA